MNYASKEYKRFADRTGTQTKLNDELKHRAKITNDIGDVGRELFQLVRVKLDIELESSMSIDTQKAKVECPQLRADQQ